MTETKKPAAKKAANPAKAAKVEKAKAQQAKAKADALAKAKAERAAKVEATKAKAAKLRADKQAKLEKAKKKAAALKAKGKKRRPRTTGKYSKIVAEKPELTKPELKKAAKSAKKVKAIQEKVKAMPALKAGYYRIVRPTGIHVVKKKSIEKPVGGAANGNTRNVLLRKRIGYYAAEHNTKRHVKRTAKRNFKPLRASITPGTVCIVVAGVHKGKRVVFLKRLETSGLCLVSGPFAVNGCPLRRVNQIYLIATSTKIDMSGVKVPEHINDKYFKRQLKVRVRKEEGDLFEMKAEKYAPSEQRKKDQKELDKQLVSAINKREDKKTMFAYLGSTFALRNRMHPHLLKF